MANESLNRISDILMEEDKPIDFRYYFHLLRRRFSIILTFCVIAITLAMIYSAKISTQYAAICKLILEAPKTAWQDASLEGGGIYGGGGISETYFNTQQEIMLGAEVLQMVGEDLKLMTYFEAKNMDVVIRRLRKMAEIKSSPRSRLVSVYVTYSDPKLAARIANSIAENFIKKSFEDHLYYNKDILQWLEQGGQDGDGFVTVTDPLGKVKTMKYDDLINSLPAVQTDEAMRSFRKQLQDLQIELDELLLKYREKHPLVIKNRANMRFVQQNIESEKRNIVEKLKQKARGSLEAKPGRIVEKAKVPVTPLKVNRYRGVVIAGVAAVILGIIVILALDFFDNTIHIMEDFERKGILIPFLGPLPLVDTLERSKTRMPALTQISDEDERVAAEEAFRYLRVAINFSAPPETVKTLAMTSCLPGDGKSFTSTNLASSLALDGNRVLLVDGDLRRPVIHSTFNLDNDAGLSNYLTSNVELSAVVKESSIEGLSILCSGPISPNPSEILGSDRMRAMLKEANESYDRIIIDCPPLTGIGDGFVVGGLVGHLVLVVAAGKTPTDLIKHIQEQLDKMSIKILGTVLNRMDVVKERYGGYTKHYYTTYNKYYRRT